MTPTEKWGAYYSVYVGHLWICCIGYVLESVDLLLCFPAGLVSLKSFSFRVGPFQSLFPHCSVLSLVRIAQDSRSVPVTEYPSLDSEGRKTVMIVGTERVMIVAKLVQKDS